MLAERVCHSRCDREDAGEELVDTIRRNEDVDLGVRLIGQSEAVVMSSRMERNAQLDQLRGMLQPN